MPQSPVIQKKVCLLGSYAVGKTSLVRRYIEGKFDEKYQTTIGVKIDRKPVTVSDHKLHLILWDIAGDDEYFQVPSSYIRGSAGYLLVVDGTRRRTLQQATELQQRAESTLGPAPFLILLNKADLTDAWEIDEIPDDLVGESSGVLETSAKTGEQVETAFRTLAAAILDHDERSRESKRLPPKG